MYLWRTGFLLAVMAMVGACSVEDSAEIEDSETELPVEQATSPLADGTIGPVLYSYETAILTRAEIQLPIPPNFDESVFAVKFLPVELVENLGDERCSYQDRTDQSGCTAEEEIGFALAFLERPVEYYGEELIDNLDESMQVESAEMEGREGFALLMSREGTMLRYTFLPVDQRTLLLVERTDSTVSTGQDALTQVRQSLTFPDD